jgi:tight adherence protein B
MSLYAINVMTVIIACLVFFGYVAVMVIRSRKKISDARLRYSERVEKMSGSSSAFGVTPEGEEETISSLIKSKSSTESYFTSKLPKVEGLSEWLLHAGLEVNVGVFLALSMVVGVVAGLFFFVFFNANMTIAVLLGIFGMFFLPWLFVTVLTKRRKNHFLQAFPHALDMIRRALKAGHSVDRALEMVVDHMGGPVGDAFKRVTEKMRLGESVEHVLAEVANRVGVDDFRMLAIVIVLQRETGGSLAEAMENFSKIIRARQNLRKKIKALTAEGRVSAIVLIAIPFVVLFAVYVTTPTYLDPLLYTDTGQKVLIIAAVMMSTGIAVILRMVYREIY